jgi:hypothetical protein
MIFVFITQKITKIAQSSKATTQALNKFHEWKDKEILDFA